MNRVLILDTIKRLRAWYFEGKTLAWVEELINPAKPFLYNLFWENGIVSHDGRPVIGVDYEDCLSTLIFYVALRGTFKVEAQPGVDS